MSLKYLFQPIKIGRMEVQNRIAMAPMWAIPTDEEGFITPALIEYFVERARSRPGMITIGISAAEPAGLATRGELVVWDDKFLPGLQKLVKAIHEYQVKLGIGLVHGGVQCSIVEQPIGPSSVPALALPTILHNVKPPREMTRDEIRETVKNFGIAAERCVRAGFDYIELHGAHCYLISQFLSPYFNRRTDEYGGSFENRTRFVVEVIRECRKKVGYEIPIGIKINGDDFLGTEQRWVLADACRLAPILEKESINYINTSLGAYGSIPAPVPCIYEEQGAFVHFAHEVKKVVSIPVAAVGRIKNPVMADRIIKEGKADFVLMGRAQIADPEMAEKARSGRIADIRPCIADCLGCAEQYWKQLQISAWPTGITCTVNPRVGREWLLKDVAGQKKSAPRKVLVAGAGPAGLEAARRAAFSGHHVILYEKRGYIGGQVKWAAAIPKRQEIGDIIPWYERQLNSLGVEVRLNVAVREELLEQIRPDVLVLAAGSVADIPLGYITGIENVEKLELMTVDEFFEEARLTGENVLIVGVDQIGLQLADYLSEQGKKVEVAGNAAGYAPKMASGDSYYLIGRLQKKGIRRNRKVLQIEILPTDDVWIATERGKEKLPGIDTIIFADKRLPNRFLAESAARLGIETHIVGDATGTNEVDQGTILNAIATGYEVGRRL